MKRYKIVKPIRFGLFVVVCSLLFWSLLGALFKDAQQHRELGELPSGASWTQEQWEEYINK